MAAPSMSRRNEFDMTDFIARRFSEALGIGLCLFALVLAVSLWGFDPDDPSLNLATSGPSSNPLGGFGAALADVSLQTVGNAIYLAVFVLPVWGVRLILDRVPSWIWISVAALPPAVLVLAAYLATATVPPIEVWPYLVGLGGVVGDFALHRLEPDLGASYGLYTMIGSLALGLVAIGIGPREAIGGIRNMLGLTSVYERANNAPLRVPQGRGRAQARSRDDDGPGLVTRLLGLGVGGLFGALSPAQRRGDSIDRSNVMKGFHRPANQPLSDEEEQDESPPIRQTVRQKPKAVPGDACRRQ